jgi:amino acid adenylation domain-containing protein/non-ribosomal peptide synthase protein (TIGR01720 family)
MWFLEQLTAERTSYGMSSAWRLRGRLDVDALARSVEDLIARHETLRTTFEMRPEGLQQVVHGETGRLEIEPMSEALLQCALADAMARPFDLAAGPPIRFRCLRLSDTDHVLAVLLHHIACDGWSLDVMWRELSALYSAHVEGRPALLPSLPLQYADYALRQRQAFAGERLARELAYWRAQLEGAPTIVNLPTDRPRPLVRRGVGARERFSLRGDLVRELCAIAQHTRATLYMVLLAAFNVLLCRVSGQRDLVVGTAVAGRHDADTEPLIGLFINTLAVRTDLSGDPTFQTLVARVRDRLADNYMHQELPFERLVSELQVDRSLSHTPLIQVLFVLQNTPKTPWRFPGVEITRVDVPLQVARLDLTVALDQVGEAVHGRFDYDCDLFDGDTIRRLMASYLELLNGIAADASQRISRLPLLSRSARRTLLASSRAVHHVWGEWNGIHQVVAEHARHAAGAVAIASGETETTYAALNARANQLAHYLRRHGVGAETRVALCLERSSDTVAALLAVLKAGGAYVPLDRAFPPDRLAFLIADSGSVLVIATTDVLASLPSTVPVICIDRDADLIDREPTDDPNVPIRPDNLAYVIYTSGSTGRPKGVAVTHGNILQYTAAICREVDLPCGPMAIVSTFAADLGHTMLFPALCSGTTLDVVPDAVARDGCAWREYLAGHRIAALKITPTHLDALLGPEPSSGALPCEVLVLGGEACTWEWVTTLAAAQPGCRIFNHYGPTECTVGAVMGPITSAAGRRGAVPLGRPLPNTEVYVLDVTGELAPIGVAGELCIGGAGVARGYLGRPAMTADRFRPNPFAATPGARFYRTGDRGQWRADGALEFLGRFDSQVKLRGFRIEPREIEGVIRETPGVRDAVATVVGDPPHQRLVAYVSREPHRCDITPDTLRQAAAARLPDPMVPAAFVVMSGWPLTPNGKLDRSALPPPPDPRRAPIEAATPRTAAEAVLVDVWKEVLGLAQIGIHDNFFELGGDSIHSIQMTTRAARRGLRLSARHAFEHQTIASLAAAADQSMPAPRVPAAAPGPAPLTPIQHWFFSHDFAHPHHFNQSMLLEPRERIDSCLLGRALECVVTHHDAFRIRYVQEGKTWNQVIGSESCATYEHVDLSYLLPEEQDIAVEASGSRCQAALDLRNGPLARVILFDRGRSRSQRLLIVMHHLIVDGVSWRILIEDLEAVYRQLHCGSAVTLPPRASSFAEWGASLRRYARTATHEAERMLWEQRDARVCELLPRDGPGCENTVASARTVRRVMSHRETALLLRELPRAARAQVQEALLAALWRVVSRWSGRPVIAAMVEGHGRHAVEEHVDVSRTIGWFTAMRPVLLDLAGAADACEELKLVKRELAVGAHAGIGYGCWRYLDQQRSEDWRGALPELTVNYLGHFDDTFRPESLFRLTRERHGAVHNAENVRPHVLHLNALILNGALEMKWTYSAHLHRRATIRQLASAHLEALRTLLSECVSSSSSYDVTSASDVNERDLRTIARVLSR